MNKKLSLEGDLFSIGNKSVTESETVSVSKNDYKNVSNNDLTIKRKQTSDFVMPMTYRLKITTIEQIKKQARIADMGVSEYLQSVLDLVLDKINIE